MSAAEKLADEIERDQTRALVDLAADGVVRISSLLAKAKRKEHAANFDRVCASRPLKPPPHSFQDSSTRPGEVEARKIRKREIVAYVSDDGLVSQALSFDNPNRGKDRVHIKAKVRK